jgi:hypothetical protein
MGGRQERRAIGWMGGAHRLKSGILTTIKGAVGAQGFAPSIFQNATLLTDNPAIEYPLNALQTA